MTCEDSRKLAYIPMTVIEIEPNMTVPVECSNTALSVVGMPMIPDVATII